MLLCGLQSDRTDLRSDPFTLQEHLISVWTRVPAYTPSDLSVALTHLDLAPVANRDRALGAHDLRRACAKLCRKNGGDLEQIKFLLGHSSIQTTERYLGSEQDIEIAVNDNLGL